MIEMYVVEWAREGVLKGREIFNSQSAADKFVRRMESEGFKCWAWDMVSGHKLR